MTIGGMTYEATRRVETTARTFTIIEHLDEAGPSRVSAIATDLEMTKGIVHNHLSTLRELGYVTKIDDHYQLSTKLLSLGHRVQTNAPIYQAAHSLLSSYARRLDTGVVLYARTEQEMVVIDDHGLAASSDVTVGTDCAFGECLAGVIFCLASGERESLMTTGYNIEQLSSQLTADGLAVGRLSTTNSQSVCCLPITAPSGDCLGSLTVRLPTDDDRREKIMTSAATLGEHIERRLVEDSSTGRSFATEKHAWIDR